MSQGVLAHRCCGSVGWRLPSPEPRWVRTTHIIVIRGWMNPYSFAGWGCPMENVSTRVGGRSGVDRGVGARGGTPECKLDSDECATWDTSLGLCESESERDA